MGVIYKITSPTKRVYIGKTTNYRVRKTYHKYASKKYDTILYNSIKKYGWDAHKFEIIEEVADEILDEREMFWISELKTYHYHNPEGMNLTLGGDGQRTTWMHNIERREKQAKSFTKEGNPFFGKNHTEENKRIVGEKASKRNKEKGYNIPTWGAEKGRLNIIVPVLCYDSNGDFVGEYESATAAAKILSVSRVGICECCNNNISGVNGKYIFKYKKENYPLKIEVGEIKVKTERRPIYLLADDYDVMCEYPSAQEASDFWGIPKSSINRAAANNLIPLRTGHVFVYKDLYEEIPEYL